MNETYLCPKCRQPVPPNAPEGLCPRCVGALNLDSGTGFSGPGAAAAPPPPSAAELAPHFPQLEILELIGKGGMGVVYKIRQKELDRIAALKILPPGIGGDPSFAERFAREAKALAKLNHPGIVTIYDSGRTDGLYYFLMEFVDGVSLGRLMQAGRVSPCEALAIVPQICDALQYAHDHGIVHRDIKPENILLDQQGRVKVADFGLAKLMGTGAGAAGSPLPGAASQTQDGAHGVTRPTDGLTVAGKVMGTPAYMAPEQAAHPAEVDHRADIYALGVVFYQMLTGELPGQRLEPPSRKVHIDVRLDEVVLRALEKEPERRYQHVSEVKTAVDTIMNSGSSATLSAEQVGERGSRFSWIGALPSLLAPLVVKHGNRRVFDWPVIGINLLWNLALIFVILPVCLRGMSVNEDTRSLIQLLYIGFVVVLFIFRLARGFSFPLESPPAERRTVRGGTPDTTRAVSHVGAVLVLLAIWFCWYQFWRAPSLQPGKQAAVHGSSSGFAPAGSAQHIAPVVKRVSATNDLAPEVNTPTNQAPASPASVEQILAHYAKAKGEMAGPEKIRTLTMKGHFTSRDGLGTSEAEAVMKSPDKWLQSLQDTNGPIWRRAFDGSAAWEVAKWGSPEVDPAILLSTRVLITLFRGDPLTPFVPIMSIKGKEPIGGGQAYVVAVALPGQAPRLWFDTETGLLVRMEYEVNRIVLQLDFSDYRDIGGLMVPFNIREAGTESWTVQCSEVKLNEPIDDAIFARPASR